MRTRMALLAIILVAGASLSALPGTAAHASATHGASVASCGFIHASVPYTRHGTAERWRVYVRGASSCATAVKVLEDVMHLRARPHVGRSEADSYFSDDRWFCPFGNMGLQSCELPTRLPMHAPIRAHALALDCSTAGRGCPAHVPSRDL
jgi:hypothetical protein